MTDVRYGVNCSILLTDLPLLQRPAAAKAAGFDFVEFWWPFEGPVPGDRDIDAFESSITSAGVQLIALNLYAGDMASGHRGIVSVPGQSAVLRDSLDVTVDMAGRLGCRSFNALYGRRLEGVSPAEQDDVGTENLEMAAAAVAPIGGSILVEPLSAVPGYPLLTAADALSVVDRVTGRGNVRNVALLADFYHLAVNGDDVPAVIATQASRFGHIQIADAPGRGAPGTGTLPLGDWVAAAYAGGYDGYVSLEYSSDERDPFGWLPRAQRSVRPRA